MSNQNNFNEEQAKLFAKNLNSETKYLLEDLRELMIKLAAIHQSDPEKFDDIACEIGIDPDYLAGAVYAIDGSKISLTRYNFETKADEKLPPDDKFQEDVDNRIIEIQKQRNELTL